MDGMPIEVQKFVHTSERIDGRPTNRGDRRSGQVEVVGGRRGGDTLAEQSRGQQSKDEASHNERFANC